MAHLGGHTDREPLLLLVWDRHLQQVGTCEVSEGVPSAQRGVPQGTHRLNCAAVCQSQQVLGRAVWGGHLSLHMRPARVKALLLKLFAPLERNLQLECLSSLVCSASPDV